MNRAAEFREAVIREMNYYSVQFHGCDSVYLGGGTPSMISEPDMEMFIQAVHSSINPAPDTEWTIEVNPDSITPAKLSRYRSLGINRISIGIQSLFDTELRFLGRRHTANDALIALQHCRDAGFDNLSVDLIYGFPSHNQCQWRQTLDHLLSLQPEHLSCYLLMVEPGTRLAKWIESGKQPDIDESLQTDLYLFTSAYLKDHGYLHYEISNFARGPDRMSRHNRKYWNHAPYLGIGPAAHSFQHGRRWWNVRSVPRYITQMMGNEPLIDGDETLTPDQIRWEQIYFGFRTMEGIALRLLQEQPQSDQWIERFQQDGYINIQGEQCFPTVRGFLVADLLTVHFMR